MRALAIVAAGLGLLVASSGTSHAGSGFCIPPMEIDVGTDGAHSAALARGGSEVLVGAHLASLAWWQTKVDVGIGLVDVNHDLAPGFERSVHLGEDPSLNLIGPYVSLGYRLAGTKNTRSWLVARWEHLSGTTPTQSFHATGLALRLGGEIFSAHLWKDHRSAIAGAVGIGAYVEVTRRTVPTELDPTAVSAGLSMRIPLIVGG